MGPPADTPVGPYDDNDCLLTAPNEADVIGASNGSDPRITLLKCFDFSGQPLFSFQVKDEKSGKAFEFFTQVCGSVFLAVSAGMIVQLLRMTENGLVAIKKFQLDIELPLAYEINFEIIKRIGSHLLSVELKNCPNGRSESNEILVYDITTSEKVYQYTLDGHFTNGFAFSMDMSELMFRARDRNNDFFKVQKTNIPESV